MPLIDLSSQGKGGFGRPSFSWRALARLGVGCVPLAWLVPNHYMPWLSAWPDTLAIGALLLAALAQTARRRVAFRVPLLVAAAVVVALVAVLLQRLAGTIVFAGDAWLAALYLGVFLVAVGTGASMRSDAVHLVLPVVVVAIASVGVGLAQWLNVSGLQIYGAELPPGARPFGNLAQPNHLSTVAFLGLCGVGWLFQRRRLGAAPALLAATFLLAGIAMTQSRTGWLQVTALALLLVLHRRRSAVRLPAVAALGTAFAGFVVAWPLFSDALLLSGARTLSDQVVPGLRWLHWSILMEAIRLEPLTGYGWQQTALAQLRVAADFPATGEQLDHAHNVLLDLVLWNGVPIGLAIALLIGAWFVRRVRAPGPPHATWLVAAAIGILLHGLLEYALEYAYFLVPWGLAIGLASARERRAVAVGRPAMAAAIAACAIVGVLVARDYFPTEEYHRTLRAESARIGAPGLVTPPPPLAVLDQLAAFYWFAHREATPDLSDEELQRMRSVSGRFPSPPVLFRFALANGLRGRPAEAERTLATLCRIHPKARCDEAVEGWRSVSVRYPVLRAVALPSPSPQ